jgi:hypothetical protein
MPSRNGRSRWCWRLPPTSASRQDSPKRGENTAETPIHPAHSVVSYSSLRYLHLEAKGVT